MKLTNYHRDEALKILFAPHLKKQVERKEKLKKMIEADYLKKLDKSILDLYIKNKSWFYELSVYLSDERHYIKLPQPVNCHYNEQAEFLTKATKDFAKECVKKNKEAKDVKNKLVGILNKYTTDAKLVIDFPECANLFNKVINTALPAIPINDIRLELLLKPIKQ